MDNRKIALMEPVGKIAVISLLLLATASVALAQCDHNVTVLSICCEDTTTAGWFYNGTAWNEPYCATHGANHKHTPLFHLWDNTDGAEYYGFCINYTVPIHVDDTFNASIYLAEPTCKNNSIAYILNNWIIDCDNCANVSAGQSAVWYFTYINETFCGGGSAEYNHTATPTDPEWESNWIPNCTAHPEACEFINASINQSVPYNIALTPDTGSYAQGASIPLNATVEYCLATVGAEVTVVFETDAGTFENSATVFENETVDGIARATLTYDGTGTANVTVRIKDMKWFEIIDPIGCQAEDYQPTLRIINVTDPAQFTFLPGTPDIGIDKLVDGVKKEEVTHNQTVNYTLTITNTGDVNLTEIMVVDTLPADIDWADAAAPVEDSVTVNPDGTTTVVWQRNLSQFEPLEPDASFVISFNATVNESAAYYVLYRNCAEVNATSEWGPAGPESSCADVYLESKEVPVFTPLGIAALIGLLGLVVVLTIRRGKR